MSHEEFRFAPLAALPAVHGRDLKVAVVDIQHLFKEYHRTTEAQKEINGQREQIKNENNENLTKIRGRDQELIKALREDLEEPAISDKKKAGIYREFQQKTQDGVGLDRERREFLERRNKVPNDGMVDRMREILEEKLKHYYKHPWRKNQLSDHFPIWCELIIGDSDEFLGKLRNMA